MTTLSIAHVAPDEIPSLLYQFPDQAKFCHDRDQQRPRSYGHPPSPHLGLPLDPEKLAVVKAEFATWRSLE